MRWVRLVVRRRLFMRRSYRRLRFSRRFAQATSSWTLRRARTACLSCAREVADATASMGDMLAASMGSDVEFSAHVAGVDGAKLVFVEDGQPMAEVSTQTIHGQDQTIQIHWKSDGRQHWFRTDVHGPDGKLWLMGNPIYMNWSPSGRKEVTR